MPTAGSCFVKGAASFTRMTNKNLREAPITKQVHSSKLNTSLIVSFPLKSQPHYSYDLQSLLSRSLNKQKTDSREPGEKQDQDTGDLFFISTSLTKYSIQVLFCGFCKEGRLLHLARRKGELVLFQVLIASSGSYDIVLHVLQARVRISCDDNIVIQLSHQFQYRSTFATRFPLFKAFTVDPAVGKAVGWIRSEILKIFIFFTSLIGLSRAEKNGF